MLDNINYEMIFFEPFESIPKSIKGDDYGVKEIKIYKNRLYSPKSEKITLSDMNKFSTLK